MNKNYSTALLYLITAVRPLNQPSRQNRVLAVSGGVLQAIFYISNIVGWRLRIYYLALFVCANVAAEQFEAHDLTDEERRYNQVVTSEVPALLNKMGEITLQLDDKYRVSQSLMLGDVADLDKIIMQSEQALEFINHSGIRDICKEINTLRQTVGITGSDTCRGINSRRKKLQENVQLANDKKNSIVQKRKTEQRENADHKAELANIDTALGKELAMLRTSQNKKRSRTLDDFLATSHSTSTQHSTSTPKTVDFLVQANSDSEIGGGDFLSEATPTADIEQNHKIVHSYSGSIHSGPKSAVVDNAGNVLIPYRDWEIMDYKQGIAEVMVKFDSYQCTALKSNLKDTILAYKVGFVDHSGEFLDGYTVSFKRSNPVGLTLPVSRWIERSAYNSDEEYFAALREQDAAKRRSEVAKRKCELEETQWKNHILTNYSR